MLNPFILDIIETVHVDRPTSCIHKELDSCQTNKDSCEILNAGRKVENTLSSFYEKCCCAVNPCINSLGFRSDEFKKNHDGKHILFSGCSYTFGTGLNISETWANIVYKKIAQTDKCSGFFNIGWPGTSIQQQSFSMFKYFEKFGNPDVVFWCLPSTFRSYFNTNFNGLIKILGEKYQGDVAEYKEIESLYSINSTELTSFISYYQVDFYCRSNNIKLYAFPWCKIDEPSLSSVFGKQEVGGNNSYTKSKFMFKGYSEIEKFDSFYDWNSEDMINYCSNFEKSYRGKNKKYLQISRDNQHLGIAPHAFWADFIYERYCNDNPGD